MVEILSIQESYSAVPSFHIILKTCLLPPVEHYLLSSINCRRWKVTPLAYHHYFYSLIPFVLNLTSKKTKQEGFLPPVFSMFLMGKPKSFFMHTDDKAPSFQSLEGYGIAMGTYWPDAVGSHGSVLLLYRGLYRLRTAGSVCWCNTDHQKDLFCRQASIMLPLFLSSVIFHHSYLQLVYSMHRFPPFFFLNSS